MKRSIGLWPAVVSACFLIACSSEEELHSGSACLEGQHQECEGDDEKIRCICVENDSGTGADGTDDGGLLDSTADGN